MQTLKFLLAIFMASAGLAMSHAQTLTPAEYDKMLELLRQKVAEERAKVSATPEARSSSAPTSESSAPKTVKTEESAPSASIKPDEAAESPALRQTLEVLRAAVARERAAQASQTAAPSTVSKSSRSKTPVREPSTARATAPPQETAVTQPAPEQPAGPKTKLERLEELLLLYRADKITPREYHEQRAAILAEP